MPLDPDKVLALMPAAGIPSKAELARRVGLHPKSLVRLLNDPGETVLLSTAERIADAVGVPLADVLTPARPGAVVV